MVQSPQLHRSVRSERPWSVDTSGSERERITPPGKRPRSRATGSRSFAFVGPASSRFIAPRVSLALAPIRTTIEAAGWPSFHATQTHARRGASAIAPPIPHAGGKESWGARAPGSGPRRLTIGSTTWVPRDVRYSRLRILLAEVPHAVDPGGRLRHQRLGDRAAASPSTRHAGRDSSRSARSRNPRRTGRLRPGLATSSSDPPEQLDGTHDDSEPTSLPEPEQARQDRPLTTGRRHLADWGSHRAGWPSRPLTACARPAWYGLVMSSKPARPSAECACRGAQARAAIPRRPASAALSPTASTNGRRPEAPSVAARTRSPASLLTPGATKSV